MRMATIAITTNSSISVNARRRRERVESITRDLDENGTPGA
jgi:hypothetical protein